MMFQDPKVVPGDTEVSFDGAHMNAFIVRKSMQDGFQGNLSPDEKQISCFVPRGLYLDSAGEILHRVGFFPSEELIPWDQLCVVAYVYPQASSLDSGIFLTTRVPEKDMIVGLPGSSTESLRQRPFVGFTLDKDGHAKYCLCLGNGVSRGYRKDIAKLTEFESKLGDLLFEYFYPSVKKELEE